MNRTAIEWTDFTWSPVTGCLNGCSYCYARRLANGRLKHAYLANKNVVNECYAKAPFAPRFWPGRLGNPAKRKTPAKIFVCSMGEMFGPWVPDEWIFRVLEVVAACPQHTFQMLTKYPKRMAHIFRNAEADAHPNLWLGVTVENQETADERIPALLSVVGGAVRFLSCEPLTGPLTLNEYLLDISYTPATVVTREMALDAQDPSLEGSVASEEEYEFGLQDGINWLIVGAMTGPNAVKPRPYWVYDLVRLADYAQVPTFLKENIRPFVPEGYWRREWPRRGDANEA